MQPPDRVPVDVGALERDLRGWIWAAGGWSALHALGGIFLIGTGGLSRLGSITKQLVVVSIIIAFATAAAASWLFSRSFRARTGLVAAGASLFAGAMLVTAAIVVRADLWALGEGVAHTAAGVGMAQAVRRARPFLYSP